MFEKSPPIRQSDRAHLLPSQATTTEDLRHNVHQQQSRKVQEILTILFVIVFISWVMWLSRPREATEPLFSELHLSGSISLLSEVVATCQGGIVTIDNAVDDYTSRRVPFRLQLVTDTSLAYGYYSLPNAAMEVRLELLDENGGSSQVFSAYEGTVDLRLEGIYLSTLLRNEQGAAVYISGQTFCTPS